MKGNNNSTDCFNFQKCTSCYFEKHWDIPNDKKKIRNSLSDIKLLVVNIYGHNEKKIRLFCLGFEFIKHDLFFIINIKIGALRFLLASVVSKLKVSFFIFFVGWYLISTAESICFLFGRFDAIY